MTKPRIMIGIPTHDQRIHLTGMYSIMHMIGLMAGKQWETRFDFSQSSDIVQSRAFLAMNFMDSDYTHLLMIDTDLDFNPEVPIKLVESGHMLCGGAYPKKKLGNSPEFTVLYDADAPSQNGFLKVHYLGGGMLLIRRPVFEKIKHHYPELTATDEKGGVFTSYFQSGIIDGRYRSEDAAFCYRWEKLGGSVWCIEDAPFTHFGPFGWGGNFAQFLAIERKQKADAA